jgi:hypothetical protein
VVDRTGETGFTGTLAQRDQGGKRFLTVVHNALRTI